MRLGRYKDHGGNAAVSGKRQSVDQFFVRHDPVTSGRQYSIDSFEQKGVLEDDDIVAGARRHWLVAAPRRVSG